MNLNNQNGNSARYPFIVRHSNTHVDNASGLSGVGRDLTKTQLDIARAISELRRKVNQMNDEKFAQMVERATKLPAESVPRYVAIGDAYLPADPDKLRFRMGVLCGMGWQRLEAFLPYIHELYDDGNSPLRGSIHLTDWSLEAWLTNGGGNGAWVELRQLAPDSIRDLRQNLVILPQQPPLQSQSEMISALQSGMFDNDVFGDDPLSIL